jgi:CubicO group peptidase (beta-lactamase class C family)
MFRIAAWFYMGAFQQQQAISAAEAALHSPGEHGSMASLLTVLRFDSGEKNKTLPLDEYVKAEMTRQHIPGMSVAIVRDGKLVLAKGYGIANLELSTTATQDTVYRLASVTKPFVAMVLMMMVEESKLSLDDPVGKYVPDLPVSWQSIPLRNLADMTSGIKNLYDAGIPWQQLQLDTTPNAIIAKLSGFPAQFQPGEKWNYSSTNYILLRLVIEKVSGKRLGELFQERIFGPLDMNSTRVLSFHAIIKNRAAGYTFQKGELLNGDNWSPTWGTSGAELASTASDMAKWNAALDSGKLLSQSSYEEMWKPWNVAGSGYFGLGWFLGNYRERKTIWFSGGVPGTSPNFTRYIDDKLSIIVLANTDSIDSGVMANGIAQFYIPPPKALHDTDLQTTQRLKEALVALAAGHTDPASYTPQALAALSSDQTETRKFYLPLGALNSFVLIQRTDDGDSHTRIYRASFEHAEFLQRFTLSDSGKIAAVGIDFE